MIGEDVLVSVILPVANEKLYLREAVESIIWQSYPHLELLIVDGSDNPKNTIGFLPSDGRIRLLTREKQGVADALNFGIHLASGKYIARMDADDVSHPKRLEKQVTFFENHEKIDLLCTGFTRIGRNGEFLGVGNLPQNHDELMARLLFENPICHSSVMFRSETLPNAGPYQAVFVEDYDLWTRFVFERKAAILQEQLVEFRRHDGNLTLSGEERLIKGEAAIIRRYQERLFGLDLGEYPNGAFVGNYHLLSQSENGRCLPKNYIRMQVKLLNELCKAANSLPNEFSRFVLLELQKRWSLLKECYYFPNEYNSERIPDAGNGISDRMGGASIEALLQESELRIEELYRMPLHIVIYGYGEIGKKALKRIEMLRTQERLRWELLGVVDKRRQEYNYLGKQFMTIQKDDMERLPFDKVLIASVACEKEIKKDLLENGIDKAKLLSDAVLYRE